MKKNSLNNILHFFAKYIWVVCVLLSVIEIFFTFGTASVLTQESARGMIRSVCGEVSGRVDGVLRLLQGLASDVRISDVSLPLYDRAILALPYQDSYDLYMIALTDEDVNVISCDEKEPPEKPTSLAYRDYMQELYATGKYQITDAFVAGADHKTVNYTIAVPIMKDGVVRGSVFGSIYFDTIKSIIEQNLGGASHFYLLGKDNTIMAGNNPDMIGKSFLEATKETYFLGKTREEIDEDMKSSLSGTNWEWDDGMLWYVNYQMVEPTNWTITYRVPFTSVFQRLLPGVIGKIVIYILICVGIAYMGKKYISKYFTDTNHLLERMSVLQKEIFQTESTNYDELIDLTQRGLNDQLTGLCTRTVLIERATKLFEQNGSIGAVFFIDLDDLKKVNDFYGHESGDCAIIHFASVLTKYASQYNAIAARYGGDEFIFLIDSVTEQQVNEIVEKMSADFCTTLQVKENSFQVHASIGVCYYSNQKNTLEDLICRADLALYTAKQAGKNCYAVYKENQITSM